ncbi:TetR/AcrR family transcriptional regulator [Methylocapsa sp. S129]|uniref:TetR/AcrR family transcriptional regulator n=1 Tax=Methylocapsa sp. S129 TaxID=1641869 RepID=UPI00131A7D25|nr:TetR/AcrR family transcriptional regulator [Methylocapsa sp. S129]
MKTKAQQRRQAADVHIISPTRKHKPSNGARDPERTRRKLLDSAYREFAALGFHGASVEKICESAGVSKQILFHHFGSKEKIYLEVLEKAYEASRAQDPEFDSDRLDPIAAMRHLVGISFDHLRANRAFVRLLADENSNKGRHIRQSKKLQAIYVPLIERIAKTLRRGEEAGVFRAGVDPNNFYISISALSFFYFSNIYTLQAALVIDMESQAALDARRAHVMDFAMAAIAKQTPGRSNRRKRDASMA